MNQKKWVKYAFCLLGIISVCSGIFLAWGNQRRSCQNEKEYGLDPFITLSGILQIKAFPGPPEYSSIENGDRADFCWVLNLDKESFILALSTPVQELGLDFRDIIKWPNASEVFLFPDQNVDERFRSKRGQHISISGYLFHAHTIHHYSPMLLTVPEHFYIHQKPET
jgi:hypothetical protein